MYTFPNNFSAFLREAAGGSPWNAPVPCALESSQMISIWGKDRALGLESNLQKQGQDSEPSGHPDAAPWLSRQWLGI